MAGGRPFKWIPGDPEFPGDPRAHQTQPVQACQAGVSGPAMEPAGAGGRWYPPSEAPEPIDQSPQARIDAGGMPMGVDQAQRGAVAAQYSPRRVLAGSLGPDLACGPSAHDRASAACGLVAPSRSGAGELTLTSG